MLTLLVLLQNLRWMVPTTLMMGAAPGYLTAWAAWRAMSLCLPNWVYVKGDDFLFTTYQRHVLFCFETLTGVQVCKRGKNPLNNQLKIMALSLMVIYCL